MAGGIGLAPLRPVIYRLLAERDRFAEVAILYGTRSPADILFRSELENWRQRLDVTSKSPSTTLPRAGMAMSAWSPR